MTDVTFAQWAQKWGIPPEAISDYLNSVGAITEPKSSQSKTPESLVSQKTRLEASRAGVALTRNNVGAGKLENGRFMRWGLWNESAAMNENFKSPDLIGIAPITITPQHVGTVIGQFVARETKKGDWVFRESDKRAQAQLNCINFINARGGNAKFTTKGY